MRNRWINAWILISLAAISAWFSAPARAADDTNRFNGTWKATVPYNGQMITLESVHDGSAFKTYVLVPNGSVPVGTGTFSAVDGKWTITSTVGNDSGTYQFTDDNTAVCKNLAGVTVLWQRDNTPVAPAPVPANGNGNSPAAANDAAMKVIEGLTPAGGASPDVQANVQSKIQAGDFDGALAILNEQKAGISADPFLCVTHAEMLLKMENYRQARFEMSFFLQRVFNDPDAYVVHAEACAAMGDERWADLDLALAAQLRPATAEADRKAVAVYAAIDPPGFGEAEIPGQLEALVKMAGDRQPYETLVRQAMRIVKGEFNIRRVEADDYRERKRQLVAAVLANPGQAAPLADLSSFLVEQASMVHGEMIEGVGNVSYRPRQTDIENQQAITCAEAALRIDPRNGKALACRGEALIALGNEDQARTVIQQALLIDPNEPELLRMLSQLSTRLASDQIMKSEDLSRPATWEDSDYYYIRSRSPEDLEAARRFDAAANDENDNSARALQRAVENTKGTAACFYYQAIRAIRANDKSAGAAAMEQAVKLAPDNVEYRDLLAHFYGQISWRSETAFFTQWSIADNLVETSASKMLRLAYKQLRRTEYDAARQSVAEAMRIDPANPRGPAYMGLLIAGENKDRAKMDETVSWLMAGCALEEANLRLWGLRHPTPNIMYTHNQVGLEEGLASTTGARLLVLNRPQDALLLARHAIDDANRVDKAEWPYRVPTAILPITSVQGTPAPHMDPVKAAPVSSTTIWVRDLHKMAAAALKAMGRTEEAAQEYDAAGNIQQSMDDAQRNAPPPPMRR